MFGVKAVDSSIFVKPNDKNMFNDHYQSIVIQKRETLKKIWFDIQNVFQTSHYSE